MTDQNNAAQAAEQAIKAAIRKAYDDGYNDAKMAPDNCSTYCVERAVRLDSAALQSALRAPVADEREMSLAVALHFADFPRPYHTLEAPADTNGELYRALSVLAREYRAAQASAPVAGEAQTYRPTKIAVREACDLLDKIKKSHGYWGGWSAIPSACDEAINLLRYSGTVAAPQASEAVRIQFPAHLRKMWSGGEVQAWLDEHQGVTPPKVSAKGSLERYRKWQAEREEAFGAGVKAAADLVKKTVEDYDANHGSTDCETGTREYPGEGPTWVCEMQELEESIRALSVQPARKPATSAPSPAASQRQAMIPASRESGNSHTDGGAVYE